MRDPKPCTNPDERCDGEMVYSENTRYPGAGMIGRGLNQPLNLPESQYGPGWTCGKCGHVEIDDDSANS
jgi:hypothetical protein